MYVESNQADIREVQISEETEFLAQFKEKYFLWNYHIPSRAENRKEVWSDGSAWNYTNYASGEPNRGKSLSCIWHGYKYSTTWDDTLCTKSKSLVCKKDRETSGSKFKM